MNCKLCNSELEQGSNLLEYLFNNDVICKRCRNKFIKYDKDVTIDHINIYSLYVYDDYFERVMFWFKECRDICLKDIFLYKYKRFIENKYAGYTIVYVPSSEKKNKERTFMALEEIFKEIDLNKINCLYKTSEVKQNVKGMSERKDIAKYIGIDESKLTGIENILLVDDVCTSGSSFIAAYNLLKKQSVNVQLLCVAIHPLNIKEE